MNSYSLQNYLFTSGSKHPVVRTVKEFLNAHPRVRFFNLPLNQEFDAQTQTALAEYQKYKSLTQINGLMTPETYRAIGADMNGGRLKPPSLINPYCDCCWQEVISGWMMSRGRATAQRLCRIAPEKRF